MTKYPELYAALTKPFEDHEIKHLSKGGKQMDYVDARTVAKRLDEVFGFESWEDRYIPGEHSVQCTLIVTLPDGTTVSKTDAGGYQGMADQGDDDMSGYSNALKRAAVKFGIGRHLYGGEPARGPQRPAQQPQRPAAQPPRESQPPRQDGNGQSNGAPRSGKALFAWTKKQEEEWGPGLLKIINDYGKVNEYPGRMVDWGSEEVADAYAYAVSQLPQQEPSHAESAY